MHRLFFIFVFSFLIGNISLFAQEDNNTILILKDTVLQNRAINPLQPAKAAFYSAIVPGLGQAYNKQYWKVPVVYVALGTGIYFYAENNRQYHDYRDAYKRRLAGYNDDKFQDLDDDRLIRAQKFYQKNRDLSILITAGLYILNIIDANVSAHLLQFNVDENLSFKPDLYQNPIDYKQNLAITLSYSF